MSFSALRRPRRRGTAAAASSQHTRLASNKEIHSPRLKRSNRFNSLDLGIVPPLGERSGERVVWEGPFRGHRTRPNQNLEPPHTEKPTPLPYSTHTHKHKSNSMTHLEHRRSGFWSFFWPCRVARTSRSNAFVGPQFQGGSVRVDP